MADGGVKQNPLAEGQHLLSKVTQQEESLRSLRGKLTATDDALNSLLSQQRLIELLGDVCRALEDLDSAGGSRLLWQDQDAAVYLRNARQQIDRHEKAIATAERSRNALLAQIENEGVRLEYLKIDLSEAREREAARANEWVIERDPGELPRHELVMPWARNGEEDRRLRGTLVLAVIAAGILSVLVSLVAIPAAERPKQVQLPERVARLVREERQPPPPPPRPVEEPVSEEETPEPEPELDDEQVPEEVAEPADEQEVVVLSEQEVKEKVKTKGILAFRDSIASSASLSTTAQLGAQARVRGVDDEAISRPQRSMVTSNAPGLGSGINLADLSRDVGGGGGAVANVEVSRVASSIDTDGAVARPQASAALAGRTDEDIQIVFDRYKAALYRLYNRELRKDPRLRGQMVLKLTIEPDGSVSSCAVESSTMQSPQLELQVVERVRTFDFGAMDGTEAVTIIYPIDFMPAS